jgi:RND family efflux transporter MFP subunit
VRLARLRHEGKGKAEREAEFPILLALPDNEGFVHRGKLDGTGVRVDPATGTVRWHATFANPDGLFLPGMFVQVRVLTGAPHRALLVPESAVGTDQGQPYVFVVTGKDVIEQRPVKLGVRDDRLRAVKEGLTAEDRVVVDLAGGTLRGERPGTKVKPKEVPLPAPKDKPRPQDP